MTTVVLCDDDPAYRRLARTMLEADYEVVGEAANGEECVDVAKRTRPELVVLDINMPGPTWIATVRTLATEVPETRVIGLSVETAADYEEQFVAAGGHAFIEKPRDVFSLRDNLRLALGQI
jgi:DNA-binding NarL/FixJ family response regulator